jgi:hypothetical protein
MLAVLWLLAASTPALAWNGTGHMVVARLAWRQLAEERRNKVIAILKKHPHWNEYLVAGRRDGFTEDDWAFMRAATWADCVRGRRDFDHPTWHYINYPIIEAGLAFKAADHEPPAKRENVVNQLAVFIDKIKSGTDEEKAVYMTWLFDLVGDIHQPLHCTAVFSERFPDGDRGGNLAMVRTRTSMTNLHLFRDGLPERGETLAIAGGLLATRITRTGTRVEASSTAALQDRSAADHLCNRPLVK